MSKLDTFITTRIDADSKKAFKVKAAQYGDPSAIHRELLMAFIEDRLIMEPPADHPLFTTGGKNAD